MRNQIRQNVRNYLVAMTVEEVRAELDLSIGLGDDVRADYVAEYLCELEAN